MRAIWKWNNQEVEIIHILESHNEARFIYYDEIFEEEMTTHDDLKNLEIIK